MMYNEYMKSEKKMNFEAVRELANIRDVYDEEAYIQEHAVKEEETFGEFLNRVMEENHLSVNEVMEASGINRNYGYNIFRGVRSHPSRDKVIALCIGAGMTLYEAQRALTLSGNAGFSPECERDIRIIRMINIRARDVVRLNLWLFEKGLEPLKI